jgi:hypothetical protein
MGVSRPGKDAAMTLNPTKPAPHDDDEAVADHFDLRIRQENHSMPGREEAVADAATKPAVPSAKTNAAALTPKKPRR